MSPMMTVIQMSVLDIMKACIAELKRYNPCVSTGVTETRGKVVGGVGGRGLKL